MSTEAGKALGEFDDSWAVKIASFVIILRRPKPSTTMGGENDCLAQSSFRIGRAIGIDIELAEKEKDVGIVWTELGRAAQIALGFGIVMLAEQDAAELRVA